MATCIYRNISNLLTLQNVSKKQGRHITEADLSIIKNAAIVTENKKILWYGPEKDLKAKTLKALQLKKTKDIDCKKRTVMPGFVECHTHSVFAGSRSAEFEMRMQGKSYQEIANAGGGILNTLQATRKASEAELLHDLKTVVARFRKQGVSCLEIKSGYGLDLKNEAKLLKVAGKIKDMRIVRTYLGPHALPPEYKTKDKAHDLYIEQIIKKDLAYIYDHQLAERVDIFVEKNYFQIEQAKKYLAAAKNLGFMLSVHAEQMSRTGATDLAVDMQAHSADHIIEINEADIKKLAKSNTVGVLLPTADKYISIPYPPARKLIDAGACVALATDFNPGTSPTQDLAFVGLLARMDLKMSLPEVIAAYTWNAAKALGLETVIGSIEVGKNTEMIALDAEWTELFYSVGHMPVHSFLNS